MHQYKDQATAPMIGKAVVSILERGAETKIPSHDSALRSHTSFFKRLWLQEVILEAPRRVATLTMLCIVDGEEKVLCSSSEQLLNPTVNFCRRMWLSPGSFWFPYNYFLFSENSILLLFQKQDSQPFPEYEVCGVPQVGLPRKLVSSLPKAQDTTPMPPRRIQLEITY